MLKSELPKILPRIKCAIRINTLTQEIETVIKENYGFTPELIGRFDSTICYESLTELDAIGIVQRKLDAYSEFLSNKYQIEVGFGKTQQYKGSRIAGLEKGTNCKDLLKGGNTEELETKEEETGVVEVYPVTVALATIFADMTNSEKKGARQVHEVFRNNINRLGSELEDEEEGYVAGDKVEFYVQAVDRETGDDIDSEEAPELTKSVEALEEDYAKEAIRIALGKWQVKLAKTSAVALLSVGLLNGSLDMIATVQGQPNIAYADSKSVKKNKVTISANDVADATKTGYIASKGTVLTDVVQKSPKVGEIYYGVSSKNSKSGKVYQFSNYSGGENRAVSDVGFDTLDSIQEIYASDDTTSMFKGSDGFYYKKAGKDQQAYYAWEANEMKEAGVADSYGTKQYQEQETGLSTSFQ